MLALDRIFVGSTLENFSFSEHCYALSLLAKLGLVVLSSREALLAHLRSRLSFFSILYLSFCDVVKNIQRIELGTNLSRIIVCVLRH